MESILDLIIIISSFVLLLGVIIGIHELGHFSAARYFNIYVIRFKIGFGKTFFKRFDKHGTEFSFGILPLGGYVQMLGEASPQEQDMQVDTIVEAQQKISYKEASLSARAIVTAAGPIANFVLAIVAYFFIFLIGAKELAPVVGGVEPDTLASEMNLEIGDKILLIDDNEVVSFNDINGYLASRIGETGVLRITSMPEGSNISVTKEVAIKSWLKGVSQTSPVKSFGIAPFIPAIVSSVQEGGPADKAGILKGDIIISVAGSKIQTWNQLSQNLSNKFDKVISIEVDRRGQRIDFKLTPNRVSNETGIERGVIGIMRLSSIDDLPEYLLINNKENIVGAFVKAITQTYKFIILILDSIGKMISGSVSADNIGGPIQISLLAGSAAKAGLVSFLSMMAILSINLGLINLFPIPILDGGQLVLIAIEKIKGSPVSDSFLEYSFRLGLFMVASLMVFAIFNDIVKII
tara:strand:- start:730 stop:2121 length:1392 start_codon:yes stop_codon:yes gene_type:complete